MRKLLRRKPPKPDPRFVIQDIVIDVIKELQSRPLEIHHRVTRNIPRPSGMVLIFEDMRRNEYQLYLDVSYKNGARINIPVSALTGRDEDNGITAYCRIELEYDPRDRIG